MFQPIRASELDPDETAEDQLPEIETNTLLSDATLADLQLSEGLLEFDPSVTEYSIEIDNTVEILVLRPVPTAVSATVEVKVLSADGDDIKVEPYGMVSGFRTSTSVKRQFLQQSLLRIVELT